MSLKDSIVANKTAYNAAIDSAIAQINATRDATNVSFDKTIDQVTKVATDFPDALIAPSVPDLPASSGVQPAAEIK